LGSNQGQGETFSSDTKYDVKPHGFTPKMEANHTATPTHTHGQNGGGQNE